MAGSKTANKNIIGKRTSQRDRFLIGTDEPVIHIMIGSGKRRWVWGVKDPNGGYRYVDISETELRS